MPDFTIENHLFYFNEMVQYNALNGNTYYIAYIENRLMWREDLTGKWHEYRIGDRRLSDAWDRYVASVVEKEILSE